MQLRIQNDTKRDVTRSVFHYWDRARNLGFASNVICAYVNIFKWYTTLYKQKCKTLAGKKSIKHKKKKKHSRHTVAQNVFVKVH